MKRILSVIIVTAASLGTGSSLLGQATTPSTGAKPAQDAAAFSQDEKEKAEDAALLQQLDAGDTGPKHPQNQWAPGALPPGGGGMAGVAPAGMPYHVQTLLGRPAGSTARPLLVRTSEPEPKAQAALEEDLSVMAHILDKALEELPGGQRRTMPVMGIDVFFSPGSTPMRSLYLDNYGAVFFLSVGFPLVAPPEKHQDEKPAGDSAWEDARQELYGQRLQATVGGEPAEEYSQDKVDKLKETLLETLKNASNIRELKPDEFVTLWVSGGASGAAGRYRVVKRKAPVALGGDAPMDEFRVGDALMANQPATPARRTVLTMRVGKADIDAYAKSKLSPEEFAKRARITIYAGAAAGSPPEGVVIGGGYAGRTRF